jgi:plastocyanin
VGVAALTLTAMVTVLLTSVAGRQAQGASGSIRGRVEFKGGPSQVQTRPIPARPGAPPRRLGVSAPQAVLYLATAPRGAFEQPESGRAKLDQRDETFVPHLLAITTGTVVDFPNSDSIYHNVFSLSKVARFDLGRYAAGRSRSVRFEKPGIVRVFCDIHSHMSAFILVFSHPFFAISDEEGRYRLDGIPAGTYSVVAWSDKGSFEPRTVTVADGTVVQLDFSAT